MPLIEKKSKKAFEHNVKAEIKAGKPQPQALAIAYSIKRKPKKMANGGTVKEHEAPPSAKSEKRPMPGMMNDSGKAPKNDQWTDQPTVAQARKPSHTPLKHPKMVPSNAFSVRLRNQEDHLEMSAEPNNGPQHQPPKEDNEIGPDRQGPKVPDMQKEHNNHRKPYAKGGMINEEVSMKDAEDDMVEHPAGLESDDDMMKPSDEEIMADHFAEGGIAHEMDDQPEPEEEIEHDASIAGAIMRKRMADGGILSHDSIYSDDSDQADVSRNADEDANEEDQSSFNALRKENYSETAGLNKLDSPKDSNEHGHKLSDEDAHDMVSKIRKLMSKRSPITK